MFDLNFSFNWNNKLDCNAFTSIRLYQPEKHFVGNQVNILLKGHNKGSGVLKGVKPMNLRQINDYIAYLDTGYDAEECKNILRRMYSKVDFESKLIVLLLIVKDK
jgi:hypothetical protein